MASASGNWGILTLDYYFDKAKAARTMDDSCALVVIDLIT